VNVLRVVDRHRRVGRRPARTGPPDARAGRDGCSATASAPAWCTATSSSREPGSS